MAEFGTPGSSNESSGMTNKALQSIFDACGDRVCIIKFDSNNQIYIGYPSSSCTKWQDIELRNVDGVDMIGVRTTTEGNHREKISFVTWHVTATLFWVAIMDEKFKDYRIDPFPMH